MIVLGIESSCDETAAAVAKLRPDGGADLLANVVYTQHKEHLDYGGVIPEIAARAHLEHLDPLVRKALADSQLTLAELDGIAATAGPGLLGGLLVGVSYAKSLALAAGKPFLAINHLEGHALSPRLAEPVAFPYLLLLVSGGHCQFVMVEALGQYKTLGGTLDDAPGEAFDKVAKMLGLDYPGGPAVEKAAKNGNPKAYDFPKPLHGQGLNLSFSGIKTAVRQMVTGRTLNDGEIADICASFQATVAANLAAKTKEALKTTHATRFVVAGGVAANASIRAALEDVCQKEGAHFMAPPLKLCTDNAAMIAYAGVLRLKAGMTSTLAANATPRWPLDSLAQPAQHGYDG